MPHILKADDLAFPTPDVYGDELKEVRFETGAPGLSTREYFACHIMAGLAARPADRELTNRAALAVAWADDLIAALNAGLIPLKTQ